MKKLRKNHGLNPSIHRIVYVDDHEGTLAEMEELPLDLYQASRGYTSKSVSRACRVIQSLGGLP